ncbi:nuclear exosome regulator NRDE2 [Schistocerca serialis cubense]|uniref:nuclear exosome regulator NRDE2 n=1 Tax=Schistocerca serialis cubense TaxID=2023355 RepID=UPI00214EADEB|nr:nuclear exosome regulator NRDE2 [Schistocerca serialis cubense]
MSLFPAYAADATASVEQHDADNVPKVRETGELPWLHDIKVPEIPLPQQDKDCRVSSETQCETRTKAFEDCITNSAITTDIQYEKKEKKYERETHSDSVTSKKKGKRKSGSDSDTSNEAYTHHRKKRRHKEHHTEKNYFRKKKKKKLKRRSRDESPVCAIPSQEKTEDFYEDKCPNKGFLKVDTLYKPAVPVYKCNHHKALGKLPSRKAKKRNYRYYLYCLDEENSQAENWKGVSSCEKQESEIMSKTEEYNVALTKNPNDVDMWIQYVNYQEVVHQFERAYRGVHGKGTMAERQLSIIDRALALNPGNKQLVRKRVTIAESSLSADVASRQIEALLSTQPTSIELWRGFVRTTQWSMALCSAPGVLNLYIKATQQLHQSRRGAPASQTPPAERAIIDLVLDCGLFLRQAGLWEHVWLLVQAYLTLNLITPTTKYFELKSDVSEDDVMTEEMKVMRSQLPLMTLWARVERIREDAHWLPVSDSEESEDPQRHVTGEDIAGMVHPITEPMLNFRLIAVCISLLKVPLLPCRDCWVRLLGIDQVPWAVDGPEWFLPVLQPPSPLWKPPPAKILQSVLELVGGPQYLLTTLGQPVYLNSVCRILRLVSDILPEPAATAFLVWWLRFERLMVSLEQSGICKLPSNHRKLRSSVKDILKQERYRNNLSLYREFALLELDLGHNDSAQRILSNATEAAFPGMPVAGVPGSTERAALIALYRSLCEVHLARGDKAGALETVLTLASNRSANLQLSITETASKFVHIGAELLNDSPSGDTDGSEILLPDAAVDWVTCHAWMVYLTESPLAATALFEKLIPKFEGSGDLVTKERCRAEALWESYICMLQWHCRNTTFTFSVLQDAIIRALEVFPNNLHFLASLAELQNIASTVSVSWCHLTNSFASSESVLPQAFLILDLLHRHNKVKEANIQAFQFLSVGGPVVTDPCEQNRCLALLERLLVDQTTKHCPLLWRLKLKIHPSEETFYRAVDECPWVRDIYLDGTLSVPEKADKLQTLMMEKELRYHVLPDELEVIRSGFEALAGLVKHEVTH